MNEDAAYAVLGDLCDRDRIPKLGQATYTITRWRERDGPAEEGCHGQE